VLGQHEYEPEAVSSSARDVVSAWLLALLLLVGGVVSVALDHVVTVSHEPVETYAAAVNAAAAAEGEDAEVLSTDREFQDQVEPSSRRSAP
jgi:hypothetical protein